MSKRKGSGSSSAGSRNRSSSVAGAGRHDRAGAAHRGVPRPEAARRRLGRTRSWVLVGLALLCVLGMVAPGMLFATGTNSATTVAPSTTEGVPSSLPPPSTAAPVPCSQLAAGTAVPEGFAGCVDGSGTARPASAVSCPDGSTVVAADGLVGRPGGVWKAAPAGATTAELVAAGC